jgi:hypothetical protein
VPPEWWSLLDRNDLPEGSGDPDDSHPHRRSRDEDVTRALRGHHAARPEPRWHQWVTNSALIAIAALLLTVGLGTTTPKGISVILLLVGILTLLVIAGIQVADGIHRRR